ncbi:MAG TPA: hypothetical protein VGF86_08270 [Candidatus Tumulicola sp.]
MKRALRAAWVVPLALACALATARAQSGVTYFDAHNHFTGILPYYAYADLPAFLNAAADPEDAVPFADRLALFDYLSNVWYPSASAELGNRPFSPADGQRFSLGARAALVVYRDRVAGNAADLDGALERVLSATPWSEFDSAYAFRGGPAFAYLATRFYGNDGRRLAADLCRATILDLARTHVDASEQSLPFVGGWNFKGGHSDKLDTIECARNASTDAVVTAGLRAMGRPLPVIHFVLMTHTSQLATLPGGDRYAEWSKTGSCAPAALPAPLRTSPETIFNALLARDGDGKPIVAAAQRAAFFQAVVGIDTAGPETTCFTPAGMEYYAELVGAVYDAAKARRATGWHGKLLVHTHVGEGGVVDYVPVPPPQPWTFADAFATLPATRSSPEQAGINISLLLGAVRAFERAHPDARAYIVFRFAHDTWANEAQAAAMHDAGIEADVNLESNVATGAYPIARMPLGPAAVMRADVTPLIAGEDTNFALNDLLDVLVKDPASPPQTGAILGNSSLEYLLENHVRCLLGTDAGGVEHSDIVKEYAYASSLIAYWKQTDPNFQARATGVDEQTLFDNVRRHLADMASDAAP